MKSIPRPSTVQPAANIFVKNLPLSLSAVAFHDTFATFGDVLSSKLVTDHEGLSKGFGFVQYATVDEAKKAISETHGSILEVEDSKRPIDVSLFVKKEKRPAAPRHQFNNVFFKNLSLDLTEETFKSNWAKFGTITSVFLAKGEDGKPTGTGFINFEKPSSAADVVKHTRKNKPDEVRATRAFSKTERERHASKSDDTAKASSA